MFGLQEKMKFININQEYIKALHEVCSEVFYKGNDYENKPYIGILINKENRQYVIPLSSAKEKHKTWKNIQNDCFLLYELEKKENLGKDAIWVESKEVDLVKHIFSVLDVKKMIPIKEGLYSVVDMKVNINDPSQVKKYKDLLNKEYSFCLKIINNAVKKANKLYDKQISTGKVAKFCCDFKMLEEVCDKY
ncbi:MAG: type III toxin-antitoxin system ToxN/AbiQ family toxin [Agathobacter sp.]|nr:type III toxin-antitoxin system ToxN/AbiQ family toxin [Agathobacter sp.]